MKVHQQHALESAARAAQRYLPVLCGVASLHDPERSAQDRREVTDERPPIHLQSSFVMTSSSKTYRNRSENTILRYMLIGLKPWAESSRPFGAQISGSDLCKCRNSRPTVTQVNPGLCFLGHFGPSEPGLNSFRW